MNTNTIETYQDILEHFKLLQVDIDYTRYLTDKSDCTIVIENKQSFIHWSEQLEKTVDTIQKTSQNLDNAVNQNQDYETLLNELDTAIDDLIHLHTEITASCAHKTGLMEGRYLIEHAVGHYLDQVSQHINEFRYQLNQQIFNCCEDKVVEGESLPLPLELKVGVEMEAFTDWLVSGCKRIILSASAFGRYLQSWHQYD